MAVSSPISVTNIDVTIRLDYYLISNILVSSKESKAISSRLFSKSTGGIAVRISVCPSTADITGTGSNLTWNACCCRLSVCVQFAFFSGQIKVVAWRTFALRVSNGSGFIFFRENFGKLKGFKTGDAFWVSFFTLYVRSQRGYRITVIRKNVRKFLFMGKYKIIRKLTKKV